MKLAVNISLHTMNPELRCRMMNNRFAGERIDDLRRMAKAGIKLNIQIVLCKGINDGDRLRFTLDELFELGVEAVAVVPVGLTKYRDGLYPLQPIDSETAAETIDIIDEYQKRFIRKYSRRTVYASDEFFIKANRTIPGANYYDDYPQYENGVGFIRVFADEFLTELKENFGKNLTPKEKFLLITGESSYAHVKRLVDYSKKLFPAINCEVVSIKNNFFGGGVTVTGLLVGSDIIEQIGKNRCKRARLDTKNSKTVECAPSTEKATILLISDMFKADTELFLDNTTKEDVEKALNMKAEIIPRDGQIIFKRICGQ
jgi:NifB/MoaA-like Fe-S oxidoreductase